MKPVAHRVPPMSAPSVKGAPLIPQPYLPSVEPLPKPGDGESFSYPVAPRKPTYTENDGLHDAREQTNPTSGGY